MSALYEESHRQLQRQFDTQRLADRIEERLFLTALTDDDRAFIERLDLFFLAAVTPAASQLARTRAAIRASSRSTRERWRSRYDGNGMFSRWATCSTARRMRSSTCSPKRLRVNGTARIEPAEFVAPRFPGAQFCVVVNIREVFPNCPRYIHKHVLVERSAFVPHDGAATPIPAWEQMDWACAVLPHNDPVARAGMPVTQRVVTRSES